MKKRHLILGVLSVFYVVLSVLAFVSYERRISESLEHYPVEARPWVDTVHFSGTSLFGLVVACGILLGVFWLFPLRRKVVVAAIFMFVILMFRLPIVSATTDRT